MPARSHNAKQPDRGEVGLSAAAPAAQRMPECPLGEGHGREGRPPIAACLVVQDDLIAAARRRADLAEVRDQMIVQMRRDGMHYGEIGQRFGLSESRICQIVTAANRAVPNQVITRDSMICAVPGLGTRELKCIERAGIKTVGELMAVNNNEMLEWPGFGRLSLLRVRMALASVVLPMIAIAVEMCCAAETLLYADCVTLDWMM